MISIFYIISFIFLFVSFFIFYYNIKQNSLKISLIYLIIYLFFCLLIVLFYVEDLFLWYEIWLEESFIVKDPNDWVWSLLIISCFLSFFFFLPYFFLFFYKELSLFLFKEEQNWLKVFLILIFYIFFLALVLLLKDFAFSGIISLSEKTRLSFEFQPEIENFILYFIGTYSDFIFILFILNIGLIFFFINTNFFLKFNSNFLFLIFFLVTYYWCGCEGFIQDLLLSFFIIVSFEIIKWLKIFFMYLVKSKKID